MQQDTYAKSINALLARSKVATCDSCVGKNAKVPYPSRVADMTAALGTTPGFTRSTAPCALCGKKALVTAYA